MGVWGRRWIEGDLMDDHLDVDLLMWDLRRRIDLANTPAGRTVVHFTFEDLEEDHRCYWVVIDEDEVDVCAQDPGHGVDLYVVTDLRTMTAVWRGDERLAEALRRGDLTMRGPESLRRSFPDWLGLSLFARVERPARH